jgi:hypothetical protein
MQDIDEALNSIMLKKERMLVAEGHSLSKEDRQIILDLDRQRHTLERLKNKYTKEWHYQNSSLVLGVLYALGLTLAFLLATLPFFPASLPLFPMTVAGTILCFALTVVSNGVKGGIAIYKAHRSLLEAQSECDDKVNKLKISKEHCVEIKEDEKRDLFLEIKLLMIEIEYQKQNRWAQTLLLTQSVALQIYIPTMILSSLVFLSPGLSLVALGAGLGLAVTISQAAHNYASACKRAELGAFNHEEYAQFIKEPERYYQSGATFFNSKNKRPEYSREVTPSCALM